MNCVVSFVEKDCVHVYMYTRIFCQSVCRLPFLFFIIWVNRSWSD